MGKDLRLYHIVRSLRSMRKFVTEHKRRLGANQLSVTDFYKSEQITKFQNHLLDVGTSLALYEQTHGERQFRRWLVSMVDQRWRVGVLAHKGGPDSVTHAGDMVWWNLLVEANDSVMDVDHVRMLDTFDELDAALGAKNAKLTMQAFTMAKLRMP